MELSNIIQICGILASLLTSIIAIAISIKTLKQNSNMIEASTRPYVSVVATEMNDFPVLVLKNYGTSSAIITQMHADIDLSSCGFNEDHKPFANIAGTHLAPNQAIASMLKDGSLRYNFSITLRYKYMDKEYEEIVPINVDALSESVTLKTHPKNGNELRNIAKTLQDLESHIIEMK